MTISRGQMKRQLRMGGGIMDAMPRQGFFLGKVAKAVTKPFKKVVKKVAGGIGDILSSDAGKLALLGLGAYGLGTGSFGLPKLGMPKFATDFLAKEGVKGTLGTLVGGSLLGGLMSKAQEGDEEAIAATRNVDSLKTYLRQGYRNLKSFVKEDGSEDAEALEAQVNRDVSEYSSGAGGYAEGGRIEYAMGDSASDNAIQAAGIEGLPVRQNPKGVKELDLRETGGFIPPVGIKEKEDDIPAMLSNNEFVFTADAVRGMGEGDVNKGAERMYNMMKNLEAGGRV